MGEQKAKFVHVCFYAAPFGVIPLELDEVYPLSQHEVSMPFDCEVTEYVATQVAFYIKRTEYKSVVFINDPDNWQDKVKTKCLSACKKKNVQVDVLCVGAQSTKEFLASLENTLSKNLSE